MALLAFVSRMFWAALAALPIGLPTVSAAISTEVYVATGPATIQNVSPTTLSIGRASEATILNWNSFSFVTNEAIRVIQPSVHSIALNRIIGADQSVVLGQLSSDSQIILINPHRNLSDTPIQINTGEFLATTLHIRNAEAPADHARAAQNQLKGLKAVVNRSTIHVSEHGYVALVAPGVPTEGVIVANVGTARPDSEQKVTLDLMSDGLIRYAISKKTLNQVTGLDGTVLANAASNTGTRQAGSGQVILSATSAGDILSSVVNTGGVSRAHRLVNRGGVVRLEGDDLGLVQVAETVDAPGMATNHRGGQAPVLGESANLPDKARMGVPGRSGGSLTLLNGNDHDQKPTPFTTGTPVATDPRLKATVSSNSESEQVTPRKPPLKARQDTSQNTNSLSSVPGHPKPKSAATIAAVVADSALKATVPSNRDSGKVNPQKLSPKVRQDRLQSTISTSAVWRQPKWNFQADWDETTASNSGNGQVTTPIASQPTR